MIRSILLIIYDICIYANLFLSFLTSIYLCFHFLNLSLTLFARILQYLLVHGLWHYYLLKSGIYYISR